MKNLIQPLFYLIILPYTYISECYFLFIDLQFEYGIIFIGLLYILFLQLKIKFSNPGVFNLDELKYFLKILSKEDSNMINSSGMAVENKNDDSISIIKSTNDNQNSNYSTNSKESLNRNMAPSSKSLNENPQYQEKSILKDNESKLLNKIISNSLTYNYETGITKEMIYCQKCGHKKLPRMHHSSDQHNCIARFDHVCQLTGTAIGLHNYYVFFQLIMFSNCFAFLLIITNIKFILFNNPNCVRIIVASLNLAGLAFYIIKFGYDFQSTYMNLNLKNSTFIEQMSYVDFYTRCNVNSVKTKQPCLYRRDTTWKSLKEMMGGTFYSLYIPFNFHQTIFDDYMKVQKSQLDLLITEHNQITRNLISLYTASKFPSSYIDSFEKNHIINFDTRQLEIVS